MLLCFPPLILTHFWSASTLLREPNALVIPSLPVTDPQILERSGFADEVRQGKFCWAMDLSLELWLRTLASRNMALLNRTLRIGFRMVERFRKIDEDFGGFASFNKATALLSPFFLNLLLGCSSTLRCAYEHLSPNWHPASLLFYKHSWECHFSADRFVQKPLR